MLVKSSTPICQLYIGSTLMLEQTNYPVNLDHVMYITTTVANFNQASEIITSYDIVFKMADGTDIHWCYYSQNDADADIAALTSSVQQPIYHTFSGNDNLTSYQNNLLINTVIKQILLDGALQYPNTDYKFDNNTGTISPTVSYTIGQKLAIFF